MHTDQNDNLQVSLSGRKLTFHQQQTNTLALNVAATNGIQQFQFVPTTGTIARLKYVGAYAPAIAGAIGSQYIDVTVGTNYGSVTYQLINKAGSNGASVSITNADNTGAITGLTFNAANPLVISFVNNSNVAQTGTNAAYNVIWEEEAIV